MAIVFEPGQKIELELPGGKYAGTITECHDLDAGEWIFKVEEKVASEKEVQAAKKLLAAVRGEEKVDGDE